MKIHEETEAHMTNEQHNCAESLTPQETRQEIRRSQILDAASNCFVSFGFHNAGMARIARAAKMSVGHIYHYYENKDAIIAAIVERHFQEYSEAVERFGRAPDEDFIDTLVREAGESITRKSDIFNTTLTLEILAECNRSPTISRIVWESDLKIKTRFAQILQEKTGYTDAIERMEALFTLFGGLTERVTRNPDLNPEKLTPYLRAAIQSILAPDMIDEQPNETID
ncbi:MAG: TetR family transcriptional regulator [Hirschia sp.]|nr:TetR family transcriptional regulator [Hirschia sp.]MBB37276.1 TetR family transcriptional regulator [Hirschia sp.]MBF19030.1 TetR family transcriptional regulator [Hirschia sp.]|tara:strand:- start:19 stop:696 length:678 start_codon:yes stop_codon:yes gene_type:complete